MISKDIQTDARLATGTRLPAVKELLRKVQSAITNSRRSGADVRASGVSCLETDYFRDRLMQLPGYGSRPVDATRRSGRSAQGVLRVFGDATLADALKGKVTTFAKKTGLSVEEAAHTRFSC